MKSIKKNVYYCDFCKKKSLSAGTIKTHEKHCTNNPKRDCRLCEMTTTIEKEVAEYKLRFDLVERTPHEKLDLENFDEYEVVWTGEPVTIKELQDRFDNCPACILSILRQTGMNRHYFHLEYDYKNESMKAFKDKIDRNMNDL